MDNKKSRRDFIKCSSLLGAGILVSPYLPAFANSTLDIAVVGAGISGLTFCYSLKKSGKNVQLFEANPTRLGGRIHTVLNFNEEGQHVELGGEHINSDQTYALNLCKELNIELAEDKNVDNISRDIYYAHGKKRTHKEVFLAAQKLGNINRKILEKFTKNDAILWPDYKTNQAEWAEYDKLSGSEYLAKYAKDVDSWFIDIINKSYSALMGPDMSEISCIAFLQTFPTDFSDEKKFSIYSALDEKYTVKGGNVKLINSLKEQVLKKSEINLGYELLAISDKVTHFLLTFNTPSGKKEIKAKQVVCALPLGALRKVEGFEKMNLTATKLNCIKKIGFGANGKLILNFKERFWLDKSTNFNLKKRFAVDELGGAFWEPTQLQEGKMGALNTWFSGNFGKTIHKNLTQETLQFYDKIWPNSSKLYDNKFAEKYWFFDKYTHGSYSCPLVGQMTTLYGNFIEPELNNRLFFIGEHVSNESYGYIEGAVETAINTVKRHFI